MSRYKSLKTLNVDELRNILEITNSKIYFLQKRRDRVLKEYWRKRALEIAHLKKERS